MAISHDRAMASHVVLLLIGLYLHEDERTTPNEEFTEETVSCLH